MTSRTRLAATLAVVAASVALPFARTPSAPEPPATTASFSAMGLSFRYPATWQASTWNDVSSFTALIVDLSTGPTHDPCATTTSPGETSVTCTSPVSSVSPGGVLVQWYDDGFPDARMPKPNTVVGGRPARETRTEGGWCASLGGSETITLTIPRGPGNWYQMEACLRAPNLSQQEAQLSAMLRTVQFASAA